MTAGEWNPMAQAFEPAAPTLTGFLLARISADEATAREVLAADRALRDAGTEPNVNCWHSAAMSHILRWSPHAVLAECEAKRQIIDHWKLCPPADDHALTPVLQLLALPYAGHPDYRAEWRP